MSKKRSSHSHDATLADAPLPRSQGSGTNTKHRSDAEGRVQGIARHPAQELGKITLAAGAVVWRRRQGADSSTPAADESSHDSSASTVTVDDIEVLLIHRPRYDDWSLAKGKLDPGETLPMTAIREIKEETGYDVTLGKLLGRVTYPVKSRTKVVYYWTAECVDGAFEDNDEVDQLVWLPLEEAKKRTTYKVDSEILEKAAHEIALSPTSRIILIRHAHAHPREGWGGNDNLRPLDRKGRRQADMLPRELAGFGITRLYSADPIRCQTTAEPLSQSLGLHITIDELFGDKGWDAHTADAKRRISDIITHGGVSAIVSQGKAIPEIIAWLSSEGDVSIDDIPCKKSSAWVLTFVDGKLSGADYFASPLPIK